MLLLTDEAQFKTILEKIKSNTQNSIHKLYYFHMLLVCDIETLFDQFVTVPSPLSANELIDIFYREDPKNSFALTYFLLNILDLIDEKNPNEDSEKNIDQPGDIDHESESPRKKINK